VSLTERGHYVGDVVDEFGRRRIKGLLETGRIVIVVEYVVVNSFPMYYYERGKAQELISKVSGAIITVVAKTYPHRLLKKTEAQQLTSKWE